jgi:putative tryptophan/tyrosine transport system substrate-binding protein
VKRRDVIVGAVLVMASARFVAGGAQQRLKTLAVFSPHFRLSTLISTLQALGWVAGRNLHIELLDSPDDIDARRAVAHAILARSPDIIFADSSDALSALQPETSAVPIVFVGIPDPVSQGFIESVAKPGGKTTGFTSYEPSMAGKWIQLLKEVAPRTRRIAVIYNPETSSNELFLPAMRVSADALGVEVTVARVHGGGFASVTAISQAVGSIAQAGDAGLVFPPDSYSILTNGRIVQIAAEYRVPAVYGFGEFVQRGGLISYGVNLSAQYSEAATYIDRILKGTPPADLPVQMPTKFELVINLNTAKALGIVIPPSLLAQADEVIE